MLFDIVDMASFSGQRLPRSRGDGPASRSAGAACAAPPLARGWTPARTRSLRAVGSPARAGMDPVDGARTSPLRLPRSRGDGPVDGVAGQSVRRLPRSRGDGPLEQRPLSSRSARGSPARAGMDPPMRRPRPATAPPLARGWTLDAGADPSSRAPPLARGWTLERLIRTRWTKRLPRSRGDGPLAAYASSEPGGSPARAGMDPRRRAPAWRQAPPLARGWTLTHGEAATSRGLPRSRGDGPSTVAVAASIRGLPRSRGDGPLADSVVRPDIRLPRSRGDGPRSAPADPDAQGSPARAGMDPRRRGMCWTSAAPPLARGWTLDGPPGSAERRGSPARAGMDPSSGRVAGKDLGSPARAGMDPWLGTAGELGRGSPARAGMDPCRRWATAALDWAPPLARGWTPAIAAMPACMRGSPARAGMDPRRHGTEPGRYPAPPLARGWTLHAITEPAATAAPPLARGWTVSCEGRYHMVPGSPARAGMDPEMCDGSAGQTRAPPLARGWTPALAFAREQITGLPRSRGDGPDYGRRAARLRRLPRSRGDGPHCASSADAVPAAPPLARGWTLPGGARERHRHGSPARAGMDPSSATRRFGPAPDDRRPRSGLGLKRQRMPCGP